MADLRGYVEGLIGFEGDGTNVVANPSGTPTDDLESIQIGNVIYNVGVSGEEIVPTPTNADRGKYLGVKSNVNELEYRNINELPSSEGANAGDVLTHTISGDSWLPPAKELPTYTLADDDKVLGISNGVLNWISQSLGGGVNYSTDEQEIGITWLDGKPIYQKTIYIGRLTNSTTWQSVAHNISNIDTVIDIRGTFLGTGDGRSYPVNVTRPTLTSGVCIGIDNSYIWYMNNWLQTNTTDKCYVTIQYTKSL